MKNDPKDDPVLADDGYPSDAELDRIENWSAPRIKDLFPLMAYVRERWKYPQYWEERDVEEYSRRDREYEISTGGWSGNESLIHALESNMMFSIIAPWSWRRGGHYIYRIPKERDADQDPA